MEIILSKNCKSFTGTISRTHGYAIRRVGNRFFSQRCQSKKATPDGHWKFIVDCAELAKQGLMFSDIKVPFLEVYEAIKEAGMVKKIPAYYGEDILNASQLLTLKSELGL